MALAGGNLERRKKRGRGVADGYSTTALCQRWRASTRQRLWGGPVAAISASGCARLKRKGGGRRGKGKEKKEGDNRSGGDHATVLGGGGDRWWPVRPARAGGVVVPARSCWGGLHRKGKEEKGNWGVFERVAGRGKRRGGCSEPGGKWKGTGCSALMNQRREVER